MRLNDIPSPQMADERHRARKRGRIVQAVVAVMFISLIARLWYLQIAIGQEMQAAAEQNRKRIERKVAPRGEIRDRTGKLLAGSRPLLVVNVDPEFFNIKRDEGRILADCLGITMDELIKLMKPDGPSYARTRVAVDIPREVHARLEEMRPFLPGVSVDLEEVRFYPRGKLAGHLLGYIGPINEETYEENRDIYARDSRVGKAGLESFYEEKLRGLDGGRVMEVDAAGNRTRVLREEASKRGADLVLSLDLRVQEAAENALTGKVGSAVALDPRTGAVLAMASRPGYDPNLFARGIKIDAWRAILQDKNNPLINRAISSKHPPASTFKSITSLAGLGEGVIKSNTTAVCKGGIRFGKKWVGCWSTHGHVDHMEAIAKSCDVFYYQTSRQMGVDPISNMAKAFGLGEKTGIDLYNERSGTVPSTEWKRKYVKRDPKWHPGETLNTAIGQGYLEATSLQMAMVTGGIAMHGKVYRPFIVRQVQEDDKPVNTTPQILHDVKLPDAHYDTVMRGLKQTITAGTGAGVALPGIQIAGKTGTAENGGIPDAWFVAVAPADNPQIAICVMIQRGRHGSTAAVPVARAMLAAYFEMKDPGQARYTRGD